MKMFCVGLLGRQGENIRRKREHQLFAQDGGRRSRCPQIALVGSLCRFYERRRLFRWARIDYVVPCFSARCGNLTPVGLSVKSCRTSFSPPSIPFRRKSRRVLGFFIIFLVLYFQTTIPSQLLNNKVSLKESQTTPSNPILPWAASSMALLWGSQKVIDAATREKKRHI